MNGLRLARPKSVECGPQRLFWEGGCFAASLDDCERLGARLRIPPKFDQGREKILGEEVDDLIWGRKRSLGEAQSQFAAIRVNDHDFASADGLIFPPERARAFQRLVNGAGPLRGLDFYDY